MIQQLCTARQEKDAIRDLSAASYYICSHIKYGCLSGDPFCRINPLCSSQTGPPPPHHPMMHLSEWPLVMASDLYHLFNRHTRTFASLTFPFYLYLVSWEITGQTVGCHNMATVWLVSPAAVLTGFSALRLILEGLTSTGPTAQTHRNAEGLIEHLVGENSSLWKSFQWRGIFNDFFPHQPCKRKRTT